MLTDTRVRGAKPRFKPYKLTDANRLYLLVTPSGSKLWRWNYEYDGTQKSMAFGAYAPPKPNSLRAPTWRTPASARPRRTILPR